MLLFPQLHPFLFEGTVTNARTNPWFLCPWLGLCPVRNPGLCIACSAPWDDHLFVVNFYPHRASWNADSHPAFWQPGFWSIIFHGSQDHLLNMWLLEERTRDECSVIDTAVLELIIDLLSINQPAIHHLVNYPLAITYQPIIYQPNTDHTWTPTNQPTTN